MPTILRSGPYRLFFYSNEGTEPVHVHVERDDKIAKFWVRPVRLEDDGDFSAKELKIITRIVSSNESAIVKLWNEYFKD